MLGNACRGCGSGSGTPALNLEIPLLSTTCLQRCLLAMILDMFVPEQKEHVALQPPTVSVALLPTPTLWLGRILRVLWQL